MTGLISRKKYLIFDFDSTFTKCEGLDELANISLKNDPNREEIVKKIEKITQEGMEGKIDFHNSLTKRMQLLSINRNHIDILINFLRNNISVSIMKNSEFIKENSGNIFIFSGGFKEFIIPIVKDFGIHKENIFANEFIFDEKGNARWFDENNLMCQPDGKVKQLKKLNLDGEIIVIGDGYTDYKMKEEGVADMFVAFTENLIRESVIKKADMTTSNPDEFKIFISSLL